MAITPDEIETRVFSLVRRGYDPAEVDSFLKEVATTLAQAQGGLATPPAPAAPVAATEAAVAPAGADDFGRLGDEVAAVLRQAHESVATLRHRAEADAALIRQNAEREAALLRQDAEADRTAAAEALQAAHTQAEIVLADVARQAEMAAESATAMARARSREVIEAARLDARGAVQVQRNVRGRLEGTRSDIDQALDRLIEEDEDLFGTIDLTDAALAADARAQADLVPPPGQGPPTPPVPPPARTPPLDVTDLPYATDDDELVEGEEPPELPPVDLTDAAGTEEAEVEEAEEAEAGLEEAVEEAEAGLEEAVDEGGAEPDRAEETESESDPLAQMVRNAVENALRRRKHDDGGAEPDPGAGNGA